MKYYLALLKNKWFKLLSISSLVLAAIAPFATATIPILLGFYLFVVVYIASNRRFQKFVDLQAYAEKNNGVSQEELFDKMMSSLYSEDKQSFKEVKQHCVEIKDFINSTDMNESLRSIQIEGIDKMLSMFLTLLYNRSVYMRFLNEYTKSILESELRKAEKKREGLTLVNIAAKEKLQTAMDRQIDTIKKRLDNHSSIEYNLSLCNLDIDRLKQEIQLIKERQISGQRIEMNSQLDFVSSTMSDMDEIVGIKFSDMREIPNITEMEPKEVKRKKNRLME